MADIELVIKIPEEYYYAIKSIHNRQWDTDMMMIQNSVPLPKGHGDLISKEQAIDLVEFYQLNPQHFDFVNLIDEIKDEKPIIEADTQNKEKENKEKEDITPYVTGVTLLSVEEARNLDKEILKADKDWWLRSHGHNDYAAFVYSDYGDVNAYGNFVNRTLGLRPALEISKSSGYKIGESVDFGGHSFTIISDTYALCDDVMGECPFRHDFKADDANEYEASDIKRYIEYWFEMIKEQNLEEERDI